KGDFERWESVLRLQTASSPMSLKIENRHDLVRQSATAQKKTSPNNVELPSKAGTEKRQYPERWEWRANPPLMKNTLHIFSRALSSEFNIFEHKILCRSAR